MDLTRLPVGEAIIGFLATALIVMFVAAITLVDVGSSPADETPNSDDNGGEPTPVPGGGTEIVMGDNFFEPTDLTVAAGETVAFELVNQGAIIHNMHIAGLDGEYAVSGVCDESGPEPCSDPDTIPANGTGQLVWDVPAEAAGLQLPFRCDFHPVEMTGTITVQ